MPEQQVALSVELEAGPDSDAEEWPELTSRLREELLDLDVEAVQTPTAEGSLEGSKGAGLLEIGSLVVQFVRHSDVLTSIVNVLKSWKGRRLVRSVKLTLDGDSLEIAGVSSAEQERLVELWIARHAVVG
jgi:hypothetical protein